MGNINNHGISNQSENNNNGCINIPDMSKPLYIYISCEFHTINGEILDFKDIIIDRRYRLQPTKFPDLQTQLGISDIEGKFNNINFGDSLTSEEVIFKQMSDNLCIVNNTLDKNKFH